MDETRTETTRRQHSRRPSRRRSAPAQLVAARRSSRSPRRRRALRRPRRPGHRRGRGRGARPAGARLERARPARGRWPALLALFVVRMWPGAATTRRRRPPPRRGEPRSSRWLIGLPIAGADRACSSCRARRTRLLAADDARRHARDARRQRSRCCACRWAAAYHFNQDVVWMPRFGIHYHVAVDGISLWLVLLTTFITPIAAYASFGSIETRIKDWCFALLLLEGGDARRVRRARSLPLLRVLGADARPDVRDDRRLGRREPHQERDQVLPLHDVRLGADARGHPLPGVRVRAASTAGSRASTTSSSQRLVLPRHVQIWLCGGVHARLRHQGADVAGAHLAAGRAHRGADGGLDHPGRRHAEDGDLRLPALLDGPLPRGVRASSAANLAGVAVLGGIIYGALCAWKQDDVKRLIAYSSVAHLGYVMLGLFA